MFCWKTWTVSATWKEISGRGGPEKICLVGDMLWCMTCLAVVCYGVSYLPIHSLIRNVQGKLHPSRSLRYNSPSNVVTSFCCSNTLIDTMEYEAASTVRSTLLKVICFYCHDRLLCSEMSPKSSSITNLLDVVSNIVLLKLTSLMLLVWWEFLSNLHL